MRQLVLIASALALSACGSNDGGAVPPPVSPPPVALADTFYSAVLAVTGAAPEDQEPAATDNAALSAPEDSEPVALP